MSSPDQSARADSPELTAIVVVGSRREYAGVCLRTLLDQGLGDRLEIVLVDVALLGAEPVAGSEAPQVRRLPLPEGTLFGDARAAGFATARAPVIAFLEEHTYVLPGWATAVLEAHRGPWVGVGTRIVAGNPTYGRSRLIGLLNYGHYAAPLRRGESARVPGHNATYKTDALRSLGDDLTGLLGNDLVLQQRLLARGGRFFLEPAAVLAHRNEGSLASIGRGIFLWYRSYGPLRAREGRWSWGRRMLYVVAAPAIPFYFVAHFVPYLVRERKEGWARVACNLPFVWAMQLCGALGQAVGLAFGVGRAAEKFSRYELTEPRGPL